ncbi:CAF17-like 4Fe-4S cluster assembly/insertion protein YgfZ [Peristeroidobacter agariperforans]|uniref:CAF17-like 4Fe-4S cluster assembly/insertion protein YgfZ n=1 Tax=Peristeroidobacter agariperforans TaxID=268404 RepID=UPI00101B8234|nr:folate-binding protein YgfZ [Peristeroidobacter agariperforans]
MSAPISGTFVAPLTSLATIMVSGADARAYLQGQLTADLDTLSTNRAQLACCNSPQGRVQAVFWTLARTDGIALVLPAALIDSTVLRLRKYVLRAKAKIEPAKHLHIGVAPRSALAADVTLPEAGSHHEIDGVSYFTLPGMEDVMVLGPLSAAVDAAREHEFHLSQVRAGLPQVYPETHEAFVAQMLNIDLLGGIDFEKGCYTGQEIIARAHFRGTVKRRMFLFHSTGAAPAPGTRVLAGEQHAGDVVDAAATEAGCDVLAVISLAQLNSELHLDGQDAVLSRLPMPYSPE